MNALFNAPGPTLNYDRANSFSLATMLRAVPFANPRPYMQKWIQIVGASSFTATYTPDDICTPYTVIIHEDGVILGFDGLQNTEQAERVFWNSAHTTVTGMTGTIQRYAVVFWSQMRADVLARVAAAPNRSRIVCVGHSMGGLIATIAAKEMVAIYGNAAVRYCMAFGSPQGVSTTWRDSMPCPTFSVEMHDDHVPSVHLGGTVHNQQAMSGFVTTKVGQQVIIDNKGNVVSARPWYTRIFDNVPAVWQWYNAAEGLGEAHGLKHHTDLLGLTYRNFPVLSAPAQLWGLNYAMNKLISPFTSEPVAPSPTSPAASPPVPTVAQLQVQPTAPTNPATGTAPTYSSALVGSTQRTFAQATVTTAPVANQRLSFTGADHAMIHGAYMRMIEVSERDGRLSSSRRRKGVTSIRDHRMLTRLAVKLDEIALRDATINAGAPANRYSTRALIIDPGNTALVNAFITYKGIIDVRALLPFSRTYIVDRTSPTAREAERLLLQTFARYCVGNQNYATQSQ